MITDGAASREGVAPVESVLRADLAETPRTSDDPARLDAAVCDVLQRLHEPQRRYHDARHVLEVRAALGLLGHAHPATVLAAWLHDIVYDPAAAAGISEAASADVSRALLQGLGAEPAVVAETSAMIEATATHRAPRPAPGDDAAYERLLAFLDADLWILSAPRARFDEYCADVRAEFSGVPDVAYAAARTAVLTALADGDRIYSLAAAQPWEASARDNLAVELARLSSR